MTSLSLTYLSSVGRIWSFVGSSGPGVLGMAVSLSPLDGSKNLAARSPATTRPLIGIRDLITSLDNVGEVVRGTVPDDELAEVTVPRSAPEWTSARNTITAWCRMPRASVCFHAESSMIWIKREE